MAESRKISALSGCSSISLSFSFFHDGHPFLFLFLSFSLMKSTTSIHVTCIFIMFIGHRSRAESCNRSNPIKRNCKTQKRSTEVKNAIDTVIPTVKPTVKPETSRLLKRMITVGKSVKDCDQDSTNSGREGKKQRKEVAALGASLHCC